MVVQDTYKVDEKEYSREQLLAFGKDHYPKLYWMPRVIGFIIAFAALLILGLLGLVYLILDKAGAIDADFPTWVFIIPTVVFGMFFLTGIILIVISCIGRSEQKYINHAITYLTKVDLKQSSMPELDENKKGRILDQQDIERLERYGRLLKGGVITQEEYDQKKNF